MIRWTVPRPQSCPLHACGYLHDLTGYQPVGSFGFRVLPDLHDAGNAPRNDGEGQRAPRRYPGRLGSLTRLTTQPAAGQGHHPDDRTADLSPTQPADPAAASSKGGRGPL